MHGGGGYNKHPATRRNRVATQHPLPQRGGGPYGSGRLPSRRQTKRSTHIIAKTPVKRYVRPKQRVSSHTKEHAPRKRITEDSPKWDAKTMGNKSGLRKQDGKLYLHGQVIHPHFPITSMTDLRKFYTNVLSAPERSFKNRVTNPKAGGRVSNALRFNYSSKVGAKKKRRKGVAEDDILWTPKKDGNAKGVSQVKGNWMIRP